jgi:hypothetical protein
MSPIIVTDDHGLRKRCEAGRELLRPIAKAKGGPAFGTKSTSTSFTIAYRDGAPPESEYTSWRFLTIAPLTYAQYYERWERLNGRAWQLERAYLHLFRPKERQREEEEYICIHCDPLTNPESPGSKYKRGLHLHCSAAGYPLKKAHFALDGGYLESMLRSSDSLNSSWAWVVALLREEVLSELM